MFHNTAGFHNREKGKSVQSFCKLIPRTKKHKRKTKLKSLCPIIYLYIKELIDYLVLRAQGLGLG